MRLVALAGGTAPTFTVPGTLTILIVAVLYGVAGGVLFALIRGQVPGYAVRQGLAYGVLILACFGPVYFLADQEGELHVSPLAGVFTFSVVFVLGGAMIGALSAWLSERLPRGEGLARCAPYRAFGLLGVMIALGCLPAILARVMLAIQRVSTVAVSP